MIIYNVRSRALIDIVNEMKSQRLIVSPFFQRNLVWRLIHKKDFIDTILKGFPFPQIFIARGKIDVLTMTATSCVVDGQQRLNAIREYIADEFDVEGNYFSNLTVLEKETFLKYQIAVIELDLKEDDEEVIEIFKRLNRTFYSLSSIEKFSTEYASSEFMIVAKLLCNELFPDDEDGTSFSIDPNIPKESLEWARTKATPRYQEIVLGGNVFSNYETQRLLHLMFTLNIMATSLEGFYNRNDGAKRMLDDLAQEFPNKDQVVDQLEQASNLVFQLNLQKGSYWLNKANMFSLLALLTRNLSQAEKIGSTELRRRLDLFESNLPSDYSSAAKEGVNNKKERTTRDTLLEEHLIN